MPRSLGNLTVTSHCHLPVRFASQSFPLLLLLALGQHTFSKWPGRCLVSRAPGSEWHSCLRPWGHVQGAPLSSFQSQRILQGTNVLRGRGGRGWLRSSQFRNKINYLIKSKSVQPDATLLAIRKCKLKPQRGISTHLSEGPNYKGAMIPDTDSTDEHTEVGTRNGADALEARLEVA